MQEVEKGVGLWSGKGKGIEIANGGQSRPCARHGTGAAHAWAQSVLTPSGRSQEVRQPPKDTHLVTGRARVHSALVPICGVTLLHDTHIPDDTETFTGLLWRGQQETSTLDGAQVFFYKNCSSIGRKDYYSRCIYTRIPLILFNLSSISSWGQKRFWLTTLNMSLGPLVVCPLMPPSVEKIIVDARKPQLQHNFNWPKKLPKYFAQKISFVKQFIFLVQNPSLSPKLSLVKYKGLEHPTHTPAMPSPWQQRGLPWEKSSDSGISMLVL